jgi:hypothetical protein
MCMRDTTGKPYDMQSGTGYIHRLNGDTVQAAQRAADPTRRKDRLSTEQVQQILGQSKPGTTVYWTREGLDKQMAQLGSRTPKPELLAIPMYNSDEQPIGIRYRADNGRKWSERGSRSGLFLAPQQAKGTVVICEGPSDTAAIMGKGIEAIGRPDCGSCVESTVALIRKRGYNRVIILADRDVRDDKTTPGFDGAMRLGNALKDHVHTIIALPKIGNDAREWCKQDDNIMEWLEKGHHLENQTINHDNQQGHLPGGRANGRGPRNNPVQISLHQPRTNGWTNDRPSLGSTLSSESWGAISDGRKNDLISEGYHSRLPNPYETDSIESFWFEYGRSEHERDNQYVL